MLGSIISTIGNVAGGIFNANKQEKFAKNALQWKAADAEKAGISKIFAMGAPTHSFNPVSIGPDPSLSSAIDKQMGQGGQQSTTTGKVAGVNHEITRAQLDGLKLDNDIKRAELASKLAVATQPGAGGVLDRNFNPGGPDGVVFKSEIQPNRGPNDANLSYGLRPEIDMYRSKEGYVPAPPQNLSEVHENNAVMRWQWMLRNQLLPYFTDSHKTVPFQAPEGTYWTFDPVFGQYVLANKHGDRRSPNRADQWEYLMNKLRR